MRTSQHGENHVSDLRDWEWRDDGVRIQAFAITNSLELINSTRSCVQAMFVTWLGLAKNFTMTIGKAVIGVTSNSAALVADAAHSASDMVSDVVAVATLKVARMPGAKYA